MADRRVHAENHHTGWQIVRYERAGKWFFEPPHGTGARSLPVKVRVAAYEAAKWRKTGTGIVHYDLRGGLAFDRNVDKFLDII